jgi:hypothetical protein
MGGLDAGKRNRNAAIAAGAGRRLSCTREIAEQLFGAMPRVHHSFFVTCDPAAPLTNGCAVGAMLPHNATWCIGYVRTKHPQNAKYVCVEYIGESSAGELKFRRENVALISGVIARPRLPGGSETGGADV